MTPQSVLMHDPNDGVDTLACRDQPSLVIICSNSGLQAVGNCIYRILQLLHHFNMFGPIPVFNRILWQDLFRAKIMSIKPVHRRSGFVQQHMCNARGVIEEDSDSAIQHLECPLLGGGGLDVVPGRGTLSGCEAGVVMGLSPLDLRQKRGRGLEWLHAQLTIQLVMVSRKNLKMTNKERTIRKGNIGL
ncbi:uncharacterized protein EI90DRAFT_3012797 [Cantharellus anzutake]|uniref:uncharacterized protein n=1 Tax=Cantharellus anzutake TaxID=1750568 RepID=UPI001906133C|nr:uncharacterized protein EI90DRAFT_3012797 [Cantharellus anzutake]KAF8339880.1 hypothetical protein EI90DRAFT_3012797 [Cantharellus anzutake]